MVCEYWWYTADVGQVIGALSFCHLESQEGAWEAVLELMISRGQLQLLPRQRQHPSLLSYSTLFLPYLSSL